jgi:hypothetical protein
LRPLRQQATQAIRPSANPFYFPSLTQSGVPRVASAAKPLRSGAHSFLIVPLLDSLHCREHPNAAVPISRRRPPVTYTRFSAATGRPSSRAARRHSRRWSDAALKSSISRPISSRVG